MTYDEALTRLEEIFKELAPNVEISTLILIADTNSGKCRYMVTGLVEVQAAMLKILLQAQPALSAFVITGGPVYPSA